VGPPLTKRGFVVIFLLCLGSLGAAIASAQQPPPASYDAFYAYDAALPLQPEVEVLRETPTLREEHVVFSSAHDERVPALLWLPATGQAPYPCVVTLHGIGMTKEDIRPLAALLVPAGMAVLAYDAQYHGERKRDAESILSPLIYRSRDALVQTVVDGRRVVDYLLTRPEIDPQRIGLVGLSLGGILGGVLAGEEPRFKAVALVVAGGGWGDILRLSRNAAAVALRNAGLEPAAAQAALDPVDPIHFVARIPPRPLLFINGRKDEIIPVPASQALQALAAAPSTEVQWLEAGHTLAPAAPALLLVWLRQWL
jgi:fermentation-respiration switch protein FrsA (DUF1100 family)